VARTPSIQDLPKEREYKLIFKKYSRDRLYSPGAGYVTTLHRLSLQWIYGVYRGAKMNLTGISPAEPRREFIIFCLFLKNKGHIRTLWKDSLSFWYHNDAENMHSPNTRRGEKDHAVLSVFCQFCQNPGYFPAANRYSWFSCSPGLAAGERSPFQDYFPPLKMRLTCGIYRFFPAGNDFQPIALQGFDLKRSSVRGVLTPHTFSHTLNLQVFFKGFL